MDTVTDPTYLDLLFLRWLNESTVTAEEIALRDAGLIGDCEFEFGPHDDHSDCDRMVDLMTTYDDYDDTDYSGWYGGERGYQDGLRWSDFI